MIQKVFGVRDTKALAFLQPYFSNSTGAAVRAFSDEVNNTDGRSMIQKHPEDFVLYELGEFDDNTGAFVSHSPIKMLGCGADFVQVKSNVKVDDFIQSMKNGAKEEVASGK